jgi:hypothetical protein
MKSRMDRDWLTMACPHTLMLDPIRPTPLNDMPLPQVTCCKIEQAPPKTVELNVLKPEPSLAIDLNDSDDPALMFCRIDNAPDVLVRP